MAKTIKVGEIFKATLVRKGSGKNGDYHFVSINLKEGEWKDGKECIDKVSISPIDSEIAEGEYLKITRIDSVWKSCYQKNNKWYDNVNVGACFVKISESELPKPKEQISPLGECVQLPTDEKLPF
ncbi:MAG: hypothetical protein RR348_04320 [Clostridia bacterium]